MTDHPENDNRRSMRGRRAEDHLPSVTEAQIALMVEEEVERRMAKLEDRLMMHMDVKFGQLHRLITDAFPDGDPHGHRMFHERSIKTADQWSKFKMSLVDKLAAGGVWAFLVFMLLAAWDFIKREVTR